MSDPIEELRRIKQQIDAIGPVVTEIRAGHTAFSGIFYQFNAFGAFDSSFVPRLGISLIRDETLSPCQMKMKYSDGTERVTIFADEQR